MLLKPDHMAGERGLRPAGRARSRGEAAVCGDEKETPHDLDIEHPTLLIPAPAQDYRAHGNRSHIATPCQSFCRRRGEMISWKCAASNVALMSVGRSLRRRPPGAERPVLLAARRFGRGNGGDAPISMPSSGEGSGRNALAEEQRRHARRQSTRDHFNPFGVRMNAVGKRKRRIERDTVEQEGIEGGLASMGDIGEHRVERHGV